MRFGYVLSSNRSITKEWHRTLKTELLPRRKAILPTGTDLSSGEVACLPDDVLFLTRTNNIKAICFSLFSKSLIYPSMYSINMKGIWKAIWPENMTNFLLLFKSLVDALWIWPALSSLLQPRPSLGDCYVHFLDLSVKVNTKQHCFWHRCSSSGTPESPKSGGGEGCLCWIKTPLFCLLQIVRRYSDFDLLNNSLQVNVSKHWWHTWLLMMSYWLEVIWVSSFCRWGLTT